MMMATFVQNGSVFQGRLPISTNGKELIIGKTWVLMAPMESLNMLEKLMIVIKAGTAQGRRKIIPNSLRALINFWFRTTAVKIPRVICNVVAQSVQIMVQLNTATKVSR